MVSLGQKLKMPKTCENPFYNNIKVLLCKKQIEKNTKYSRNETSLKIGHLAKAIAHAKAIAFAKWSVFGQKLKMPKTCEKPFYKNIKVLLCKKQIEKNTKYSRNERSLKIGHLAKAIAHAKAIAFAKWSVLGQKLKMPKTCEKPFCKNIKAVLWKKQIQKTPNILEMREV